MQYEKYFGGSVALHWSHFHQINGYPNRMWGWGGEDDELYKRVTTKGIKIKYLDQKIGRFKCLDHDPTETNEHRWQQLRHSLEFMSKDGLNSLNYSVNKIIYQSHYTHVFANI